MQDADLEFIRSVTTYEIYAFMNYVADDRNNMASTRQRKTTTLRSIFWVSHRPREAAGKGPTETLVAPQKRASPSPIFFHSNKVSNFSTRWRAPNAERDRCILTLFLNCGMRLSELVAIDLTDVLRNNNTLRILGKGNKERIVYLNQACQEAISRYLAVRPKDGVVDRNALFLSNRGTRIKPITVEVMVKKYLEKIGLSGPGYSVHKLRHTAATLMYRYGNVDIRVLQDILGHTNLGTTEIYTHTSSSQMEQAVKANPLAKVTERRKKPKPEPGTGTSTPAGGEDTEK